ncbi:uncharacterized protein C11orf24 homolog isoform X1 [Sinocyclocheilus grahami]|uniref:uncharacterized protein C11orf24 homolog isoform X1 n=1 Tax=Sinocyclocheilus grahami TaxID=75366 RepID=UPI0007ACA418|nr:PREDICTED: uncharacterized protein C11orf24 homolog isoform X1 [Sinocyclocheilus grahami]
MVSATHVIMTVHPVLVLLPILGLLVLPCAPLPLENGLRIVANVTVDDPGECGLNYCPEGEVCWKAIVNTKRSVCFLISCPNNTQNFSCENVTNFNDLLVELGVITNDSIHVGKNQTDKSALPYQSAGTSSSSNGSQPLPTEPNVSISRTSTTTDPATFTNPNFVFADSIHVGKSQTDKSALPHQSAGTSSSPNVTKPLPTEPNISISMTSTTTDLATLQINFTTITTTNLQTTPTEKAATTDAVAKPAITATIPTTPAVTSTTTTTPKPTTTSPKPSPTSTSTTTTTTTVAQTIIPKQSSSPSPSGANMSACISPSVPTTPSFTPSTKLIQTSAASSDQKKPSQTMSKTSLSPSVVVSALPKDIPKGDQVMIEVARDPLTSHLLNTSSLLAVLLFGLLFFVVTVALILKQAYESYKRKDYTRVDYLINGMYSDSGV